MQSQESNLGSHCLSQTTNTIISEEITSREMIITKSICAQRLAEWKARETEECRQAEETQALESQRYHKTSDAVTVRYYIEETTDNPNKWNRCTRSAAAPLST